MELELDQIELRYQGLRVRCRVRDRRLLASLSEVGQLEPIVVVRAGEGSASPIVIDGYRRVRALKRLRRDTVLALLWDLPEIDALLLRRSLTAARGETALEQGWLLDELRSRFDLSLDQLASRLDKSPSWVSRRLALVRQLPETVQDLIRQGRIIPHAGAKYLVPVARANKGQCERLARAIAPGGLSSRQIGAVYAAWRDAPPEARERLVDEPLLYLRTRDAPAPPAGGQARAGLVGDVTAILALVRRTSRRLAAGAAQLLTPPERDQAKGALGSARTGIDQLLMGLEDQASGDGNAERSHENHDSGAFQKGAVDPTDRQGTLDLAGSGARCPRVGKRKGAEAGAPGEGGCIP